MFGFKKYSGGIGEAFSDRNFRLYSVGSIASWLSFFIQIIAVNWYAWEITKSTKWLAIIVLMDIVPTIIFTPIFGALADRYDRLKIWKLSNFLLLAQAVLIALFAFIGELSIYVLAILVFLHGIFVALTVPAMYSMLPRFVAPAKLGSAIAVNSSYTQFAVFAGPALAGLIIANFHIGIAFIANAVGYAILLMVIYQLQTPKEYVQQSSSGEGLLKDTFKGFTYLARHLIYMPLFVISLLGDLLMATIYFMMPAFVETQLNLGVEGLSYLLAARGGGAVLIALWLAHGGEKLIIPRRILWSFLLSMIAVGLLYGYPHFWVAILLSVIIGGAGELRRTITQSYIQITVEENQRGRLMGNWFMASQVASGVGTYAVGAIAVETGLTAPVLYLTGFCFLTWCFLFLKRQHYFPTSQLK